MQGKSTSYSHPLANALNRGFWLLMLLAHAPALFSAWRCCLADGLQLDLLGGCLVLTASMVFFVLKLRDIGWLRFRTDRRSLLALGLVVALIHLDCLRPGLRTEVASKCAVVLVTTAVVVAVPRLTRLLRSACGQRGTTRKCRLPDGRSLDNAWLDTSQPHCWVLACNLFRLRAPPA
ncbi:MAG: hypothetical protein JSU86_06420 [Phycisphaerales bacterium]|nr:MAG: hypothetical protein JSU86_06420 [Phycisphaerales bacterium]